MQKEIPDEVFTNNGFRREDVLFFAAMGEGDYIDEMIETSEKCSTPKKRLRHMD